MTLAQFIAHELIKGTNKRFSGLNQQWINRQQKQSSQEKEQQHHEQPKS